MNPIQVVVAHVLVVDDEPAIRELFAEILMDEGYPATCAADGREALSYLAQATALPCLILLDLNMPVMSGWDFRLAQLADPRMASVPVVAVSAGATVAQQAKIINATGYLAKPVEYVDLVTTVARYCQH
ncbi:MAG: response regulator [Chloroflexota bacterium]|nr:response regulator [Chloroflexota bacterium]